MRSKLSYGNVMSTVAVFIALSGTSYAAITITGKDIRNNSLTGRDIRNSSLTGGDIRDRSLRAKDFAAGQLPAGRQGAPGPAGPQGASGATGPQGPAGEAAPRSGTMIVSHTEFESQSPTNHASRSSGCSRATSSMLAPVQLPAGTRITKVDVYVRDVMAGPGDEVTMVLYRNRLPTHAADQLALARSTGSSGFQVVTLTPPAGTAWASTDTPLLYFQPEDGVSHEICGAVVHFGAL